MSRTVLIAIDAAEQARRTLDRGPMSISSLGITAMAMFIEQQMAAEAMPSADAVKTELQRVLNAHATISELRENWAETSGMDRMEAELALTGALDALAAAVAAATLSTPLEQETSDAGQH
ncbi:hypothetical protein SAMN02983003_3144 [Devosia enhydra]|uniref:Uncharacterized protein n=1 Tax=Devosia enhydra TaxID=665118 RepID=A0A1K2I2I9_9HYPH|nr:hypothetical protein [Devosia enhydra]SFZ85972.1 hypothetical protein SAMN02983003_3144 [Devosia enhydra]